MTHRRFHPCGFAAALGIGLTLGLAAQARALPAKDQAPAVSEVVVRALSGPALWRVTKGRSELVILGSVTPLTETTSWNSRRVAEALRGARLLMLSPGSTPGFAWADRFRESDRYLLAQPLGRTLVRELGPGPASRLDRSATAIGQPLSQYNTYRPAPAGMRLLQDSWRSRRLTGSKLDDEVIGLARAASVRVLKVDEGGALPLIDAMPDMSAAQQAACIGEAMDQFDWETANAGVAAAAWARGDVATLRYAYRPLTLCLDAIPGGAQRLQRARSTWRKALADALDTPGRVVVLTDIADLLEPSDLLAFLEERGGAASRPAGEVAPGPASLRLAKAGGVETPEAVAVADAVPSDLRLVSPKALAPELGAVEASRRPGRRVNLAAGDLTCVTEVPIGTLLPRTTCLTPAQWREIDRERELQRAQLRSARQMNARTQLTPAQAAP